MIWSNNPHALYLLSEDKLLRPNITSARNIVINSGSIMNVSCLTTGYPTPFITLAYRFVNLGFCFQYFMPWMWRSFFCFDGFGSNGSDVIDAVWKSNETQAEVTTTVTGLQPGPIILNCNASNVHGMVLAEIEVLVVGKYGHKA